jgi:hypothetical protein
MKDIDPQKLVETAAQVHANLMAIRVLSEADDPDLRSTAEIASGTAGLINALIPVYIRQRRDPSFMSVKAIWQDLEKHAPTLAQFVTTYRVNPAQATPLIKPARNHLIALGIILYAILGCDNVRRALHGDLSRPIISIGGPSEDSGTLSEEEQTMIRVQVRINLDRLPDDIHAITANLRALTEEVKSPPFNRVTVAELIGPVLNTIAEHVGLPPRAIGSDIMSSRHWIGIAAKECLERMLRLYGATLRRPTDGEALEKFKVSAVKEMVAVFVTMRDIYLSPDIQDALANAMPDPTPTKK